MSDGSLVAEILREMGIAPTEDHQEQLGVFLQAFEIFVERTERHGDTWKASGWRGALFDMHKKMDRLWNEFMVSDSPPEDVDSALDLINFAAFFVRAQQQGIKGTWRWK